MPELPDDLTEQTSFFRLTDRLYRAKHLTEAYEVALDSIVELLGCRRASILQFDNSGVMRFVGWRGLSDDYRKAVDGHSPWRPGARDPEPIFVSDIRNTDESQALKDVIEGENIRALSFIPLTINRACVGKFMAYYAQPRVFSEHEKQTAMIIARQLSFFIERHAADFSASRLKALIGSSSDAIVAKNLSGIVQHWNPGAERLFGYTADEIVGKSITVLIPPERMAEEAHILGQISSGQSLEHYETVRRRKDGSLVHVSLTVSPIIDAEGQVIGASKIARDITEQHLARERQDLLLREMNHRVKNLFAVTTSIANLSARSAETPQALAASLTDRLGALGRSHSLTMSNNPHNTDTTFFDLLHAVLAPYQNEAKSRVKLTGDNFTVAGQCITPISLLFHEFATNAAKYGSLSNETGDVSIVVQKPKDKVEVEWRETGGPGVAAPETKGFGNRLIEATLTQLAGRIHRDWPRSGLILNLELPAM